MKEKIPGKMLSKKYGASGSRIRKFFLKHFGKKEKSGIVFR